MTSCRVYVINSTCHRRISIRRVHSFFFSSFPTRTTRSAYSAVHRHQPPRRTVQGQVDCFVQWEVVGSQIPLDGVQPRGTSYEDAPVAGEQLESSWHGRT